MALDLTPNDLRVLTSIFDTPPPPLIDSTLPPDPHVSSALLPSLKSTERLAIAAAEASDLPTAHSLLLTLTSMHPNYASGFNNLAQVLRLISAPAEDILAALDTAIALAAPTDAAASVSAAQANLLKMAYTQRGALWYAEWKRTAEEVCEERARRDFEEGGRWGSGVAREMAVRTNPYARLCGAIVKEALTREYMGQGGVCGK
ncbi:hypothetical protein DFP73DRAFT_316229 [Morchella snyderi]|nr:hypothetical protein DFP73DRAFT_316229 [Morchella snyderi]